MLDGTVLDKVEAVLNLVQSAAPSDSIVSLSMQFLRMLGLFKRLDRNPMQFNRMLGLVDV